MTKTLRNIFLVSVVFFLSGCTTSKEVTSTLEIEKKEVKVSEKKEKDSQIKDVRIVTLPSEKKVFLPCPEEETKSTPSGNVKVGDSEMSYNYDKEKKGYNVTCKEDSIIKHYRNEILQIKDSLAIKETSQIIKENNSHIEETKSDWKTILKSNLYLILAIIFGILWVLALFGFNPFKLIRKALIGI